MINIMIAIVAKQVIKKECIAEYEKLAAELVAASLKDAGCVSYRNLTGHTDERVHTFFEVWKDQASIDAHNASEHFTRIVPQLGTMLDAPEQVDLYDLDQ